MSLLSCGTKSAVLLSVALLSALLPQEQLLPAGRQLARCPELIAALVALQDPAHPLAEDKAVVSDTALGQLMVQSPETAVPLALAAPCGAAGRGGVGVPRLGSLARAPRRRSRDSAEAAMAARLRARVAMQGLLMTLLRAPEAVHTVVGRVRGGAGALLTAIKRLLALPLAGPTAAAASAGARGARGRQRGRGLCGEAGASS